MRNKLTVLFAFILIFLFSINFSLAALNDSTVTEKTNQAYTWLSAITSGNSSKFSAQDNSFLLLALSYDTALAKELRDSLNSQSKSNICWPSSSCNVKDTAFSALGLQRICQITSGTEDWLINQTLTPTELIWYLQVDSSSASNCTISYDNVDYSIKIGDDKKIDKNAGSCLTRSNNNYWFKVASSCYDKTFTVSCSLNNAQDQFLTSWLYQKPADNTFFVSSDTQKESSGGFIDTSINAKCFRLAGSSSSCDYESTQWATFYLSKTGGDIGVYLPYLIGYADANSGKLPEAFLYVLTGDSNYADNLLAKQKSSGYWQATSSSDKYYDTALALLALKDYSAGADRIDKAKAWLIKEAKTEKISNEISYASWATSKKDTAFILYSVWPKEPACIDTTTSGCEEMGFSCETLSNCDKVSTTGYFCTYSSDVCCEEVIQQQSCIELKGDLCGSNEECIGDSEYSSDGTCCLGTCTPKVIPITTECVKEGYDCEYSSCSTGYDEVNYDCDSGEVCCQEIAASEPRNLAWLWIILIAIFLILLVLFVLNYLKKKKISEFKPKSGYGPGYGPGYPPASAGMRRPVQTRQGENSPRFRTMVQQRPMPMRQQASRTGRDKELDDTLKKLREISG